MPLLDGTRFAIKIKEYPIVKVQMSKYLSIHTYCHEDINGLNFQDFDSGEKLDYLGPLGKINIFVGANNSGKSRFLRGLVKTQNIITATKKDGLNLLQKMSEVIDKLMPLCREDNDVLGFNIDYNSDSLKNKKFISTQHSNLVSKVIENEKYETIVVDQKYLHALKIDFLSFFDQKPKFEDHQSYINDKFDQISVLLDIIDKSPEKIKMIKEASSLGLISLWGDNHVDVSDEKINLFKKLKSILYSYTDIEFNVIQPPYRIYIPVLRTASTLFEKVNPNGGYKKIKSDIFKHTVDKNYLFDNARENKLSIEVVTGLDLYSNIRRTRNNLKHIRKDFEDFEAFLSNTFFEGKKVEIVAKESDDEVEDNIILYIGTEDRDIHHIGDGIQALIILMYTIYTAKDNSWIFIEEPELNLHPGLQRIFIEQLSKSELIKNKNLTLFFTTHSNHLLDLSVEVSDDVSIFHFEKRMHENESVFIIKNVLNSDSTLLESLGVRNSSVFLSNCTIWVEGVTDRVYIKSFLAAYCKEFPSQKKYREDIDYAFIEYAGSNLSHYVFTDNKKDAALIKAQFISNNIYLIADEDFGKDKKHNNLCSQNRKGFHYEVLKVREIENILSPVQLKKSLPLLLNKGVINGLEEAQFIENNYKSQYLGKYLSRILKSHSLPGNFSNKSGTLSTYYKNKLSKIIEKNIVWEEMSKAAQKLTENIYKFIKSNND